MTGIISYGAYIPRNRLARAEIGKAWGMPAMPGEKAAANYDEDSLTLCVAACIDCLGDRDRNQIDGLFLATTTSPYLEKQAASIVAKALDLPENTQTVDYTNSLRGGTLALKAALDAVESGSLKQVLVVAADCRLGAAQGAKENSFGDGAAALLIGRSGKVAKVVGSHTIYSDMVDVWRTEEDKFVRSWEDRFIIDKGYTETVAKAARAVMKRCELTPKELQKAVLYSPDPRSHQNLAKNLGFSAKTQLQDSLFSSVGNTGTALTLMMLVAALEEAKVGDKMLVASYGDGCDALIVEVTGNAAEARTGLGITGHLKRKRMLSNYEAYARVRNLILMEPASRPPNLIPSSVEQWRESSQRMSLYGSKCNVCGKPQYPIQRICAYCQSKDDFEPYRFSDKKGRLFTFTFDLIGHNIADMPPVGQSLVNFDGGGRMICQMADCDVTEAQVDMPVDMTFRKRHTTQGMPSYCWKSRPAMQDQ